MEPIKKPLYVLCLQGPGALEPIDIRALIIRVQARFYNIDVELDLVKLTAHDDPYPELNTLDQQVARYKKLTSWAEGLGFLGPRRIVCVWGPPAQGKVGSLWVTGQTDLCGYGGNNISYAALCKRNHEGKGRFHHSVICACHELGHYCGATHDQSKPNIMHEDALKFVGGDEPVRFLRNARGEIKEWLSM